MGQANAEHIEMMDQLPEDSIATNGSPNCLNSPGTPEMPPFIHPYKLVPFDRFRMAEVGAEEDFSKPPAFPIWRGLPNLLLYAFFFTPFTFAILQQTGMDGKGLDPYDSKRAPSRSAWIVAAIYYTMVSLLCIFLFTVLPDAWYVPRSKWLISLLALLICAIWFQQALTFRYILLSPRLASLKKNRDIKYKLCGNAYSTMNPRNLSNYISITVVLSEFFQFLAVTFHPSVPWLCQGVREEDEAFIVKLQRYLPEALVPTYAFVLDRYLEILLAVLVAFVALYLVLIGRFVQSQAPPSGSLATIISEFMAGTFFTAVVARLLSVANQLSADRRVSRMVATLCLFVYATTAVFVATIRAFGHSRIDLLYLPKWLCVERILKGSVGFFAALLPKPTSSTGEVVCTPILDGPAFQPLDWVNRLGPLLFEGFALTIVLLHLYLLRRWHPTCSVSFVIRVRKALLGIAAWGQACAFLMLLLPWQGWLVLLITTWALAMAVLVSLAVFKVFFSPPNFENEAPNVQQMRLQAERDRIFKKGADRAVQSKKRTSRLSRAVPSFKETCQGQVKVSVPNNPLPPPPPPP
eukprot:CAMPEP_0119306172 /NCGR_PEP_ID=MMETSP1333-20130426/6984_1 /TAXON_ID=418940 /ORGANISM="Scyphosphaera apsteinii, Strain RCC1455" /LENGTH=577 /DNA_ID=CAMNT_0007309411 /DNA_START=140 /DNA_END=1870 /DNA_ORIENTATION=-